MPDPLDGAVPIGGDVLDGAQPIGPVRVDFGPKKEMTPRLDRLGIPDPTSLPADIDVNAPSLPKKPGPVNPLSFAPAPEQANRKFNILTAETPDQLVMALGGDPAKVGENEKFQLFQNVKTRQKEKPSTSVLGALGTAIQKGFTDVPRGIEQGISHAFAAMIPSSPGLQSSANLSDLQTRANDYQYGQENKNYPLTSAAGQMIGQLPYVVAAAPEGALTRVGIEGLAGNMLGPKMAASQLQKTALLNLVKTGGSGAALGAAQPVVGPNFGQEKVLQAGMGAVMAPGAQLFGEKFVKPLLARTAAGITGALPEEAQNIANLEAQHLPKGTLLSSDLQADPASKLKSLAKVLNDAPLFGLPKVNSQAQKAAGESANTLLGGLRAKLEKTGFTGLPELETAASEGNRQAGFILGQIKAAGNNPGAIAQAEANAQLFQRQQVVNKLYETAKALAPTGQNDVKPIIATAQMELDNQLALGANKDDALVTYLKNVLKDFGAGGVSEPKPVLPGGNASFSATNLQEILKGRPELAASIQPNRAQELLGGGAPQTVDTSYGGLSKYLSGVGDKRQEFIRPGTPGSESSNALKRLQEAIRGRMGEIAGESGNQDFANADLLAKKTYAETIGKPFEHPEVQGLLKENTPDLFSVANGGQGKFNTMSPQQTQAVAGVLGPKGHAAMNVNAIEGAIAHATDTNKPVGYQFSPKAFSGAVQDNIERLGVTLSKDEKETVSGFANLMNHMQQAGEKGVLPGSLTRIFLREPAIALRWMLTTPFGRSFALAANGTPIGSPAMDEVAMGAIRAMSAGTGVAGGQYEAGRNPAYNQQQ